MQNMDYAVSQLVRLCSIASPTGYVGAACDYVQGELERMGFSVTRARKGNVLCCLGGSGEAIMLCAHLDTLGAMVRSIKPSGRIRYAHIGSYVESTIETENCVIHTRDGRRYTGTVQSTRASKHVYKDTEPHDEDNVEIVIDELVTSAGDVEGLGIFPGDFISFDARTVVTESGFIKSRHLDDKASAALLLNLARRVALGEFDLKCKTYIMFSTYEEVGHGGSAGIPADVERLLVVDMGCVGDDLAGDETKVSICAKDGSGPYDYDMTSRLIALARGLGLRYAVDVFPFYSSDAAATLRAGFDIAHALIGPGVFASHGYERTHIQGLENSYRLIEAFLN